MASGSFIGELSPVDENEVPERQHYDIDYDAGNNHIARGVFYTNPVEDDASAASKAKIEEDDNISNVESPTNNVTSNERKTPKPYGVPQPGGLAPDVTTSEYPVATTSAINTEEIDDHSDLESLFGDSSSIDMKPPQSDDENLAGNVARGVENITAAVHREADEDKQNYHVESQLTESASSESEPSKENGENSFDGIAEETESDADLDANLEAAFATFAAEAESEVKNKAQPAVEAESDDNCDADLDADLEAAFEAEDKAEPQLDTECDSDNDFEADFESAFQKEEENQTSQVGGSTCPATICTDVATSVETSPEQSSVRRSKSGSHPATRAPVLPKARNTHSSGLASSKDKLSQPSGPGSSSRVKKSTKPASRNSNFPWVYGKHLYFTSGNILGRPQNVDQGSISDEENKEQEVEDERDSLEEIAEEDRPQPQDAGQAAVEAPGDFNRLTQTAGSLDVQTSSESLLIDLTNEDEKVQDDALPAPQPLMAQETTTLEPLQSFAQNGFSQNYLPQSQMDDGRNEPGSSQIATHSPGLSNQDDGAKRKADSLELSDPLSPDMERQVKRPRHATPPNDFGHPMDLNQHMSRGQQLMASNMGMNMAHQPVGPTLGMNMGQQPINHNLHMNIGQQVMNPSVGMSTGNQNMNPNVGINMGHQHMNPNVGINMGYQHINPNVSINMGQQHMNPNVGINMGHQHMNPNLNLNMGQQPMLNNSNINTYRPLNQVQLLASGYMQYRVPELREFLRARNLSRAGLKNDLVQRMIESDHHRAAIAQRRVQRLYQAPNLSGVGNNGAWSNSGPVQGTGMMNNYHQHPQNMQSHPPIGFGAGMSAHMASNNRFQPWTGGSLHNGGYLQPINGGQTANNSQPQQYSTPNQFGRSEDSIPSQSVNGANGGNANYSVQQTFHGDTNRNSSDHLQQPYDGGLHGESGSDGPQYPAQDFANQQFDGYVNDIPQGLVAGPNDSGPSFNTQQAMNGSPQSEHGTSVLQNTAQDLPNGYATGMPQDLTHGSAYNPHSVDNQEPIDNTANENVHGAGGAGPSPSQGLEPNSQELDQFFAEWMEEEARLGRERGD